MMCNQPSSPVRRLRALAIAPALIIAAVAVNLPLVSSALTTASLVSLVADKVSENYKWTNYRYRRCPCRGGRRGARCDA